MSQTTLDQPFAAEALTAGDVLGGRHDRNAGLLLCFNVHYQITEEI